MIMVGSQNKVIGMDKKPFVVMDSGIATKENLNYHSHHCYFKKCNLDFNCTAKSIILTLVKSLKTRKLIFLE